MSGAAAPKGWKWVPVDPTPEMVKAGTGWGTARSTWAAMLAAAPDAPAPETGGDLANWRELCRRLYVELWHCDQQLCSVRDEDGEPVVTQGITVRDVLADARAALEATPAATASAAPVADHTALLKMLAHRARTFPTYPMGYHMPEVFAALGETPPTASQPAEAAPPAPAVEPQWQPIETAPKDGTRVLLHESGRIGTGVYHLWHRHPDGTVKGLEQFSQDHYQDGWEWAPSEGPSEANPTHWMPLPGAPKEGGAA